MLGAVWVGRAPFCGWVSMEDELMDKPMFVETSNGLVNLSLVQTITKAPSGNVAFWFEGVTDRLEISEKEWHRIRGGMANMGLLLFE